MLEKDRDLALSLAHVADVIRGHAQSYQDPLRVGAGLSTRFTTPPLEICKDLTDMDFRYGRGLCVLRSPEPFCRGVRHD